MSEKHQPPVVMVIGGLDPSGGAGLCADIQTLSAMGCHAAPVVTAITVQDTLSVKGFQCVQADLIRQQMQVVLDDMSPVVVKTGMLANRNIVDIIVSLLQQRPEIKLVVDPVMRSNYDNSLCEDSLISSLVDTLLPIATLMTPNLPEANALSGLQSGADDCAAELDRCDCFITGTHAKSKQVINRYYQHGRKIREWRWQRLPFDYHGSGCTLAAAIAAGLALDLAMEQALEQAQQFVMNSLFDAFKPGSGQYIPHRLCAREYK